MAYSEDDLLMLSGIRHFAFCKRQWALNHIEQQWLDNVATIEGAHLHEKVDNPYIKEKRKDLIIARSINIASYELGLLGIADVIEFIKSDSAENCIKIPKHSGWWRPKVVEYKRGVPKQTDCDKAQLCAQAMCLEEMHGITITDGAIFYNKIKRREDVAFDDTLRHAVKAYAAEMHEIYAKSETPKAVLIHDCKNCALQEICLPELSVLSASKYMRSVAE